MSKRDELRLLQAYTKYSTLKKKKSVLEFLRAFMPEIIFRTTRLEGEKVSRKMISTFFSFKR